MIPPKEASNTKRIIAIAGGKGGVGKTIITAAMGMAIAENGYRTVVVDADFGGANLHQVFGIVAPPVTIKDFIDEKNKDINELLLETPVPDLYLLAGATGLVGLANFGYGLKQRVIRNLRNIQADWILLDLGAGSAFDQLDYFLQADFGAIVITPEPMAIQDGYNFIKLCLYRRLFRQLRQYTEIIDIMRTDLHHGPSYPLHTLKSLTKHVKMLELPLVHIWEETIRSFRPKVIMNMIETEQDVNECSALQIAARDLLNIEIEYLNCIKYDDSFRRAAKLMRPELLMPKGGKTADHIRSMIEALLFDKEIDKQTFRNNGGKKHASFPDEQAEPEEIICSVRCSLWGQCRVQNGGYPCRIKMVGFFNQNPGV